MVPLSTVALAGQDVAVLPVALVVPQGDLVAQAPFTDRQASLAWADSLVAAALTWRAPDVSWKLPPELRKIARRAAGYVVDPDHMGQSVLSSSRLKEVPDPLRGNLRRLVAIAGGRFVMVPAAITLERTVAGAVHVECALVLADVRTGRIVWRSLARADGATPTEALRLALEAVVPLPGSGS